MPILKQGLNDLDLRPCFRIGFFILLCKECECILHKPTSNTNRMNRHRCKENSNVRTISLDPDAKLRMKMAAAKFVSYDLRPFSATCCYFKKSLPYLLLNSGHIVENAYYIAQ